MSNAQLEHAIEAAWESRDEISPNTTGEMREAIEDTLNALDSGALRVAEKQASGDWSVNQWAKKAVLLGFRIKNMEIQTGGPQGAGWWDKVDSKFKGWGDNQWRAAGFRAVPSCIVRKSAYIAPGVVLMPSFVNLGAYVDEGTMVDTWATVGSCAQIGKNVHLSGGVGIGGVLEPAQAAPVVVEDECMIGSRCIVVEGARVGEGAVLGAGAILSGSMPVIDVETGEEIGRGEVPAWSVAVAGTRPRDFPGGRFGLPAILVIKRLEPGQRHDKSKLNDLLRDHGAAT